LWDLKTGQEVRVLTEPTTVSNAVFSPDGRYILTAGFTIAKLWDAQTGQEVRTFTGVSAGVVAAVAFSPDGHYILTGSWIDNSARLLEVETGQEVRQLPGFEGGSNSLAFSPDGKYLMTGASENSAQLWDVETGQALNRFSGVNVAFSRDGKYLVTGGDKTAYLWDMATGRQLRAFGGNQAVETMAISPDNQFVFIPGSDNVVHLWDADYHKLVDSVCARVLRDFTPKEREQYGIKDQEPTCSDKR
jgi:WD40 repeat protein